MSAAYRVNFGSDEFFRKMKNAWKKDDYLVGTLLQEQITGMCMTLIYSPVYAKNSFMSLELDDYIQETFLSVWPKLDAFMDDPRNDPDSSLPDKYSARQKYTWLETQAYYAMKHVRDRRIGRQSNRKDANGNTVRLIYEYQPVQGNDEASASYFERIAGSTPCPDQRILSEADLADAFRDFFSLPNEPKTLAAVCFVILHSALGPGFKGEEYAGYLNNRSVSEISSEILQLLDQHGYHPDLLEQLRVILPWGPSVISGLTASKIANRKNTILSALKDIRANKNKAGKDD